MTFRWWVAIFTGKTVLSIQWRSWLEAWNEFLRDAWAHSLSCMTCIRRNGTTAVELLLRGVLGCGSSLSQPRGTVRPVAWGLETFISGVNQDSTCWCWCWEFPSVLCNTSEWENQVHSVDKMSVLPAPLSHWKLWCRRWNRHSFAASACKQVLW